MIPTNTISSTVQDIAIEIIDEERAQVMLVSDPDDDIVHECWLANGHFLFESGQGCLKSLFKMRD